MSYSPISTTFGYLRDCAAKGTAIGRMESRQSNGRATHGEVNLRSVSIGGLRPMTERDARDAWQFSLK